MADSILFFCRHLSSGLSIRRHDKERIVSEAALAFRFVSDRTVPKINRNQRLRIVFITDGDNNAGVMRVTIVFVYKFFNQLCVAASELGSPAKRALRTPGAPFKASAQIPESSAMAGRPECFAARLAFVSAFSTKVPKGSSADGIPKEP